MIIPVSISMWNKDVECNLVQYADVDTELSVVNIGEGSRAIQTRYDEVLASAATLQEAERAEMDGCEGVVLYCFGDPVLGVVKEVLHIPMLGINQAAIHLTCLIGNRFAVIRPGLSDTMGPILPADKIELYDLTHRCSSVRLIPIPVLDLAER